MRSNRLLPSMLLLILLSCFLAACDTNDGKAPSLGSGDSSDNEDDDDDDNDNDDDNDDNDNDNDDNDTPPVLTSASGHAYRFDWTFEMLEGTQVEVLERPDLPTVTTDLDGYFAFNSVYAEDELTFISKHPAFYQTQSATLIPGENGFDDVSLQVPPRVIVWGLSLFLLEIIDPNSCQIATTVTQPGGTPFSPGIAGATVSIEPALPAGHGPFYFEIVEIPGWPMLDLPMRWLTETTKDGGAIYVNVPPGEYVLSGKLDGEPLTSAFIKCRPGVLVNASPPYGLHPLP